MGKIKDVGKQNGMPRRSFLKMAGLSSLGLNLGFPLDARLAFAEDEKSREARIHWTINHEGYPYFVQKNIKTNWLDDGYILARVDNCWWIYRTATYEDEFYTWWLEEKMWYYDQLLAYFSGETDEYSIPNGGHHHPMLATYGQKHGGRGDSMFHLNNTPKGYTLIPKKEYLRDIIDELNAIYDDPNSNIPEDVFNFRREKYNQEELWDKNKFATLEVYTGHPFDEEDWNLGFKETHTFQNIMKNPMGTVTFMSLYNTTGEQTYFNGEEGHTPTFEFRGFCWMMSPHNPDLTQYEKDVCYYLNQAFSKYHGMRDDYIANLFVMTEEFNNSPTDSAAFGLGKRVVPSYNYGISSRTAARDGVRKSKLTREEKRALLKTLKIPV
jgi:hypothetical protein